MDHTLEIRWFVPGAPPASVIDWITDLGAQDDSTRTDLYLVSDDPAMNVKLREGKVQTKYRMTDPVPVTIDDTAQGQMERWVKWSFPTKDTPAPRVDDPTALWHPVHKERLQLELGPSAQAARLGTDPPSTDADAAIELTVVESRGTKAWSICVEAEGAPHALDPTLSALAPHWFEQGAPPDLPADRSFGYASWLASITTESK